MLEMVMSHDSHGNDWESVQNLIPSETHTPGPSAEEQ